MRHCSGLLTTTAPQSTAIFLSTTVLATHAPIRKIRPLLALFLIFIACCDGRQDKKEKENNAKKCASLSGLYKKFLDGKTEEKLTAFTAAFPINCFREKLFPDDLTKMLSKSVEVCDIVHKKTLEDCPTYEKRRQVVYCDTLIYILIHGTAEDKAKEYYDLFTLYMTEYTYGVKDPLYDHVIDVCEARRFPETQTSKYNYFVTEETGYWLYPKHINKTCRRRWKWVAAYNDVMDNLYKPTLQAAVDSLDKEYEKLARRVLRVRWHPPNKKELQATYCASANATGSLFCEVLGTLPDNEEVVVEGEGEGGTNNAITLGITSTVFIFLIRLMGYII